jgi:hypothetical protein
VTNHILMPSTGLTTKCDVFQYLLIYPEYKKFTFEFD